ncbi:hypothetical protein [Streptomyces sp. NPDC012825]|uniref:baeRF3 domain-containing protein n=1 Tax=Streptomyces sp. NPDC012825 TaxID=3364851 RepID=UPI0036CE3902
MPAHSRRGVEEDRVRLKNLLAEARRQLAADPQVGREERLELEAKLDDQVVLARHDVLLHAADGLEVLVAPGEETQVWELAGKGDIPTRVEFAQTFLTRYLVAAYERLAPYWVLVLSLGTSRLCEGSADRLVEVEEYGFPAEPEIPDAEDALPGRIDLFPSPARDERIQQHMRAIDERLARALAERQLPLFLIGGTKVLAEFDAVTQHAQQVAGQLELVGMEEQSLPVLAERLEPVREEFRERQTKQALQALDEARDRHQYAEGVQDVWAGAVDHRIRLLVVEESFHAAGTVSSNGRGLRLVPTPGDPDFTGGGAAVDQEALPADVATDLVDTLVEESLASGATVRFVPEGTLTGHQRIAAALRY